jgi:hypothetical protein
MFKKMRRPKILSDARLSYLLLLLPASAFRRAARLAARLAFPLAIAAKYSGVRIVFVCFGALRTSDLMAVLLILISSNAAF